MDRLRYKFIFAACLLMISFALLVSIPSDKTSTQKAYVSNFENGSTQVRRPLRPEFPPARKRFHAASLTTDSAETNSFESADSRYSNFVSSEDQLMGLPMLVFPEKESNSNTLPKQPTSNLRNEKVTASPSIEPVFQNPGSFTRNSKAGSKSHAINIGQQQNKNATASPRRSSSVKIAPAVINTYLQKVRYAESLARRGAISSSFEELKSSLKLIAEAIDQLNRTQVHSIAVQEGFLALKEVADFDGWNKNLSIFVAGHETVVLKGRDLEETTFHEARLEYLGFAEAKFRQGCQDLPLAAETFRSLGKVFLMQESFMKDSAMSQAKAMLMFRLATTVNPQDAVAARELGALYAKFNHFEEAKKLLVRSLTVKSDVNTWQNLSKIHRSLGEERLAWQAASEANFAANRQQRSGFVLWTDPSNFNQVQSMVDPPVMTARANQRVPANNATQRNSQFQRNASGQGFNSNVNGFRR